jgi:putative phosphoribosyl transferase
LPKFSEFVSSLRSGQAFQLKFKDRVGAGQALGIALKLAIKRRKGERVLVLGIPRGGVIIADIVASKLDADFDVIIPRKLTAPANKENSIGAVLFDGSVYLDEFMVKSLSIGSDYIKNETADKMKEIEERTRLFRPVQRDYHIEGRTVVLVDDGIATGATVIVAARWIRRQKPEKLIIAAPVGQPQVVEKLKNDADSVEVLSTPSSFGSVNQFYKDFDQATDERVIQILKSRKLL